MSLIPYLAVVAALAGLGLAGHFYRGGRRG